MQRSPGRKRRLRVVLDSKLCFGKIPHCETSDDDLWYSPLSSESPRRVNCKTGAGVSAQRQNGRIDLFSVLFELGRAKFSAFY